MKLLNENSSLTNQENNFRRYKTLYINSHPFSECTAQDNQQIVPI